jgi:gliding motility-associated lipoprotein GldH
MVRALLSRNNLRSRLKPEFFLGVLVVFFISSCDKQRVFEENTPIPDNIWKVDQPVTFQVDIDDTLSGHNFYMNIRHAEGYPFSNLFVFLKTDFPNGKAARDTIEFVLQNPDGKWSGSGLGDLWDSQIQFKQNIRFPLKGSYTFSIEQAMRTPALPMIMEMGMRIEKYEKD